MSVGKESAESADVGEAEQISGSEKLIGSAGQTASSIFGTEKIGISPEQLAVSSEINQVFYFVIKVMLGRGWIGHRLASMPGGRTKDQYFLSGKLALLPKSKKGELPYPLNQPESFLLGEEMGGAPALVFRWEPELGKQVIFSIAPYSPERSAQFNNNPFLGYEYKDVDRVKGDRLVHSEKYTCGYMVSSEGENHKFNLPGWNNSILRSELSRLAQSFGQVNSTNRKIFFRGLFRRN